MISNICTTIWSTFTIALAIFFAYTLAHISNTIMFCDYILICTISYLFNPRLRLFYKYLDKFDKTIGRKHVCGGKYKQATLFFILFPIAMNAYSLVMTVATFTERLENLVGIVIAATHNSEIYYFSFLQSIITLKIGIIIEEVEMKLQARDDANTTPFSDTEMRKFVKLYHILIKAFDTFVSAIKWQVN